MVIGSVFAGLNKAGLTISESPVQAEQIEVVDLISDQTISSRIAEVFDLMFDDGPDQGQSWLILSRKELETRTDTGAIEAAVDGVIAANPDKVEQAKKSRKWRAGLSVR